MTNAEKATTLYNMIIEHVMLNIKEGKYLPNEKIPTEVEFAEKFGVSRITSKKALDELARNGVIIRRRRSGSFVNPEANDIVMNGSKKSEAENVYVQGVNNLIGIVLPIDTSKGDLIHCIRGILDEITKDGYYLSIHNSQKNPNNEREIIQKLVNDGVRGIIYYPFWDKYNYELIGRLCMNDFPIITIDKLYEGLPISSVVFDNFEGSYKITRHLIEKGHKRIAFVSDILIDYEYSIRNRYIGYCKALRDSGLLIESSLVVELSTGDEKSSELSANVFKSTIHQLINHGATAIEAVSDGIAMYIIEACMELGIRIPEELSIVGFDDLSDSNKFGIPLTTVRQDLYEMGHCAANRLISLIKGCENSIHKQIIPVTLVERESVTSPKA